MHKVTSHEPRLSSEQRWLWSPWAFTAASTECEASPEARLDRDTQLIILEERQKVQGMPGAVLFPQHGTKGVSWDLRVGLSQAFTANLNYMT